MRKLLFSAFIFVSLVLLQAVPAMACFDTYCFLNKHSLAYPYKMLAVESNGEYSFTKLNAYDEDLFTGSLSAYYGLFPRFSVQGKMASSEKQRSDFSIDEWGLRGVYNLVNQFRGIYNLDMVLEHSESTASDEKTVEFSLPNIWYVRNLTFVMHPVASFGLNTKTALRGHGGVFYAFSDHAIVGLGSEYESAQSSSNFGRRLVRGEGATSLFFGNALTPNLFLQNELIKGWGTGGKDVGFAATLKIMYPVK